MVVAAVRVVAVETGMDEVSANGAGRDNAFNRSRNNNPLHPSHNRSRPSNRPVRRNRASRMQLRLPNQPPLRLRPRLPRAKWTRRCGA